MYLALQKNFFEFTFQISELCCEAVKKLFKQDKLGCASLGVVKVISGLVKGRNYDVRPEVRVFLLCYRIFFCRWFKKNLKVKVSAAAGYRLAEFPHLSEHSQVKSGLRQRISKRYMGQGKETGNRRSDPYRGVG